MRDGQHSLGSLISQFLPRSLGEGGAVDDLRPAGCRLRKTGHCCKGRCVKGALGGYEGGLCRQ